MKLVPTPLLYLPNKTTATIVYLKSCDLIQDLVNVNYLQINRLLVCAEDQKFEAKLTDALIQSTALILVVSKGTLSNGNCETALKHALKERKKIVLVHDTTTKFPQYTEISKLSVNCRKVFDCIAVPLTSKHLDSCWNRINDKIFERVKVNLHIILGFNLKQPTPMNWFLSHRQVTGQRIALNLYLELNKLGETAFLDIKSDCDLHNLEQLVKLCDFFVFVYSDGILGSQYCRRGFERIDFQ